MAAEANNWPRRGVHWDVFESDRGVEIEVCDSIFDHETGEVLEEYVDAVSSEGEDWDDRQASAFVLTTAGSPCEDVPAEVVAECRDAIREIVKSWDRR